MLVPSEAHRSDCFRRRVHSAGALGRFCTRLGLPRHRGRSKALGLSPVRASAHGPNGGVADSLDEAKAAFRPRAWDEHR
jgi:hypothetical protein